MPKFKLCAPFSACGDQPQAIETMVKAFEQGEQFQTLLGVTGSGKTFSMANVIERMGKKTLILAHNKTLAAQLYSEFKEFFPDNAVEYFVSYYDYYQPEAYVPGRDVYIEKDASINDEIDKLRHSATRSLLERDDVIVISSVSCIYGIGSPKEYKALRTTIFVGDELERDDFIRELISIQYTRDDHDFSRGSFRVRGDLVEVFPAAEGMNAIRVEFFDNEVDSISVIDPLRMITLETLKKVTIYPKSHYVVSAEKLEKAMKSIRIDLRARLQELESLGKIAEMQRLEQRTLYDLEMMEEMGYCSGIENYSRHLTGANAGATPGTLIDFFENDFLFMIDESHITVSQVGGMYKGDRARKETLVEYGFRLPSALDNRPLNFSEFEKKYDQVLFVSATPGDYELGKTQGEFVEQLIRPTGLLDPKIEVKDAATQVDDMLVECKKVIKLGMRILITTLTKKLAEELTLYYEGIGMRIRYLHSDIDTLERVEILRDLRLGEFDILVGINLLREGLDLPEVGLVGILDADKEGFLRSTRSLIQTIGRASRNSEGRVILYAYKMTKSMEKAIGETQRRREIQHEYNKKHNITPTTINKKISSGIIDRLRGPVTDRKSQGPKKIENLSTTQIDQLILELADEMKIASRELRFEDAADVRDEIKQLKELRLML